MRFKIISIVTNRSSAWVFVYLFCDLDDLRACLGRRSQSLTFDRVLVLNEDGKDIFQGICLSRKNLWKGLFFHTFYIHY